MKIFTFVLVFVITILVFSFLYWIFSVLKKNHDLTTKNANLIKGINELIIVINRLNIIISTTGYKYLNSLKSIAKYMKDTYDDDIMLNKISEIENLFNNFEKVREPSDKSSNIKFELDDILDKININGYNSLTEEEAYFLKNFKVD